MPEETPHIGGKPTCKHDFEWVSVKEVIPKKKAKNK